MKTPEDEGMNHATTGGGHHTERPCSLNKLDLVKKQTGGTEGGEKARDKFTEAAVWDWLCNWPRDWA